jgi:ATP-dependent DNA helicase DinG
VPASQAVQTASEQPGDEEREDIALVFAPGGPVARLLGDSYRPRRGQARMARLVMHALAEGQHALVEAGTGSGKSFAYLIPLIWTGSRAFVSTANKTLQNQLWEKDLPALRRIAPNKFTAALLKGRGNYVCQIRLEEMSRQLTLPGHGVSYADLEARLKRTPSGDVEEMRIFGELRSALTVGWQDCLGPKCPRLSECYYELARLRAEEADLVVLNHALLAFLLVLDTPFLQPRDVVIIDEAQEFEHYVVNALRLSLEYDQVPAFANDAVVLGNCDERVRGRAVQANHRLFTELSHRMDQGGGRRVAAPLELPVALTVATHLKTLQGQLLSRYPPVPGAGEGNEENLRHQRAMEWATELAHGMQTLGRAVPDGEVRYLERTRGDSEAARVSLHQEPVKVAEFLHATLWEATRTVICTTATLSVNQRFDYFRWQAGVPLEGVHQRIIDSPFDFARQALLYTPHGLYPQYGEGEDAYVDALAAEVERLVNASRGRAFVLCTSTRRAHQLFERLSPRLPYASYCQGMAPRNELLDLFRNDAGGAVLFATKSFWEGVDVPGEALSLVIIDKLPFMPHRDPVVQHREQRIREAGGNPFAQYMLPEASLALKQGVGRLIRTETDRGVMAILDSRINTKRYGPQMIASLPRARRTLRFEDVERFFGAEQ